MHDGFMFDIYCPHCDSPFLMSSTQIISTHRTSNGPVAYVKCPHGHLLVKEFRPNRTRTVADWSETQRLAS